MKSIVAITAALFAATAFAQAPAKKEEDKSIKPAAPAAAPAKDAKATSAAPAKKEEKKDAAKK
jgi:hypothetical protein